MIKTMQRILLALLFIFITFGNTFGSPQEIDEVFEPDGGVKPQYEGIIDTYQSLSEEEKIELQKVSQREFEGDNKLLMLPKVISEEESDLLNDGVRQRSRAIMAFLKDHYSGRKNYLKEGIIPESVMNRILHRSGDAHWQGYIRAESFAFDYGPDIIRAPITRENPTGGFLVVEDNIDYVGGRGDLIRAREIIDRHIPQYQEVLNSPDPKLYYDNLAARFKKEAKANQGIAIILSYPLELHSDHEEERYSKIFQERGIPTVHAPGPFSTPDQYPKLEIKEEGIFYLKDPGSSPQRVGHIMANMNPEHIEPSHPATRISRVLKEARFLIENPNSVFVLENGREKLQEAIRPDSRTGQYNLGKIEALLKANAGVYTTFDAYKGYVGILDQVKKGHVSLTNTPGATFVTDKEFYIYMEEIIRFYLGEEPVLKNMESGSFFKKGKLDQKMMTQVFDNFDHWVVKVVDGRGGKGIFVGPKTPVEEIPAIRRLIEQEPSRYKWQRYTPLSTLNNEYIGDIRVLAQVDQKETLVSPTPWARVVEKGGNGKVNMSDNGFEAVVMVRKAPEATNKNCFSVMKDILRLSSRR